jgi:hypothetical protein
MYFYTGDKDEKQNAVQHLPAMLTRMRVECNTLLFEQLVSIISIHSAACFFRNHQFFSQSRISDFMKPEVQLQCLQQPLTCPSSGSVVSKFLLKSESFRNNLFRTKGSYPLAQTSSQTSTPYRFSATAYSMYSQLLSLS